MGPQAIRDLLGYSAVSPYDEMVAFEVLYSEEGSSLKKVSEETVMRGMLPTSVIDEQGGMFGSPELDRAVEAMREFIGERVGGFSVAVNQTTSWPDKLADSARPTPILYYRGDIGLIESDSVSVVGSRKASFEGLSRAARLGKELAKAGVTVVSGLARGIDTAAMESAMKNGGRVIGVIGTPIDRCYPRENAALQEEVAERHLLVSQVPFYKYEKQPFDTRRFYFPERNELMAAISDATVIVEASDTSGTLTQARACMHQGRKLFILRSCYENPAVSWPRKWAERPGVHVVASTEEILSIMRGDKR